MVSVLVGGSEFARGHCQQQWQDQGGKARRDFLQVHL
jgi:hypothetical protein